MAVSSVLSDWYWPVLAYQRIFIHLKKWDIISFYIGLITAIAIGGSVLLLLISLFGGLFLI